MKKCLNPVFLVLALAATCACSKSETSSDSPSYSAAAVTLSVSTPEYEKGFTISNYSVFAFERGYESGEVEGETNSVHVDGNEPSIMMLTSGREYDFYAFVNCGDLEISSRLEAELYLRDYEKLKEIAGSGEDKAVGADYNVTVEGIKNVGIICVSYVPATFDFSGSLNDFTTDSKTILRMKTGLMEFAAADRIFVSDGTNSVWYSACTGGSHETLFKHFKKVSGKILSYKAEKYTAVYPVRYATEFPATLDNSLQKDYFYIAPMYSETGSERNFVFKYVAGVIELQFNMKDVKKTYSNSRISSVSLTADEPLSGPVTYNYDNGTATLTGNGGIQINGNFDYEDLQKIEFAIPEGSYHNLNADIKILTSSNGIAECKTVNIGTISITNGHITIHPTTLNVSPK